MALEAEFRTARGVVRAVDSRRDDGRVNDGQSGIAADRKTDGVGDRDAISPLIGSQHI